MSSEEARTGRQRQRYENNLRLVSGCIPYRLAKVEDGSTDFESRIEVLLISSPNRHDLVFPKGGWEEDETVEEAACREAWEEAGVRGIISGECLGGWKFKSKSKQHLRGEQGGCEGYFFALEVTEEFDTWPEQTIHDRKWVSKLYLTNFKISELSIKEAKERSRYEWMLEVLEKFVIVIKQDKEQEKKSKEATIKCPSIPVNDVDCPLMSGNCYVLSISELNTFMLVL